MEEYNYIFIDIEHGVSGTGFPIGTSVCPVNNLIDAEIIIERINREEIIKNRDMNISELLK